MDSPRIWDIDIFKKDNFFTIWTIIATIYQADFFVIVKANNTRWTQEKQFFYDRIQEIFLKRY